MQQPAFREEGEMVGREGDSMEHTLKQQPMHSPVDH